MKALELRQGNAVGQNLAEFPDNFFIVEEVADHACKLKGDGDIHFFESEDIEGVPLNEPLMLRLGAKKTPMGYKVSSKEGLWIAVYPDGSCRIGAPQSPSNKFKLSLPVKIRYVHELQNLMFALTGEELNF